MSDLTKVVISGHKIEGRYRIEGHYLTVSCPYGTKRVVLGLLKPERAARLLLGTIVRDAIASTPKTEIAAQRLGRGQEPLALVS